MDEYIKRKEATTRIKEYALNIYDIDLDGAKQFGEGSWSENYCEGLYEATELINDIPTADVAPVVHGRWEWFDEKTGTPSTGYEIEYGWRCSHCKEELPDDYDDPDDSPTFRFCYNCGAKMDGGTTNVL